MMSPRNKKILFYIGRNLLLYSIMIGFSYLYSRLETKKEGSGGYSVLFYYIITTFYVWAMIHNSILVDKLLLKKKYLLYIVSLIVGLLLISYVHQFIISMDKNIKRETKFFHIVLSNVGYLCYAIIFYFAFKYLTERKKFYQLSLMQRDIELQQLKAHLNPHFLFNALNNIYSYTLQHNRYGNELILKLAELMRFILDTSDKNHIKLEEELGFVTNYIVFERERLGERCVINFTIAGEKTERQIAPLILFPFIENACKYGADTIQKTEIDIAIENQPGFLKLVVKNNIVNKTPPSTKTGLQKAIRRLELLYPDKHEVLITTDEHKFSVELILRYDEN